MNWIPYEEPKLTPFEDWIVNTIMNDPKLGLPKTGNFTVYIVPKKQLINIVYAKETK